MTGSKNPEVRDYNSGDLLEGRPSEDLIRESRNAAGGTGAVPACRDVHGVWQYVAPNNLDLSKQLGNDVRTVWVTG